jgi:hypothetical protein
MDFSAVTTAIYSMQNLGRITYMVVPATTSLMATKATTSSLEAKVTTSSMEMKETTSFLANWATI